MNYQETLNFLFQQLPMYQREGKAAFKKDLKNILAMAKLLGQPQEKFKSIHIAGTNGKGSTAHMLAAVFQQAGFKTGLYTSPHLKDFRERIRINGIPITEKKVVEFVEEHFSSFKSIHPSFFEWTVALAFHYFATVKVDIAIIETGLGGRLDSTNILSPELCIITNIGLDHQEMLGNTKAEIAREKAGIIKANTPIVIGNASGQEQLFDQMAQSKEAEIYYASALNPSPMLKTDLQGLYQQENLRTVYQAYLVLRRLGWKISIPDLEEGLKNVAETTGLRGRYERLSESPLTITDTAHNEEGLQVVLEQLQKETYRQLHMVLGFVNDKKIDQLLAILPKGAIYYCCAANIPRAMPVDQLLKKAQSFQLNAKSYASPSAAFTAAKETANQDDLIYIGGSTFVVAEIL